MSYDNFVVLILTHCPECNGGSYKANRIKILLSELKIFMNIQLGVIALTWLIFAGPLT